jgi:hypothetical protein
MKVIKSMEELRVGKKYHWIDEEGFYDEDVRSNPKKWTGTCVEIHLEDGRVVGTIDFTKGILLLAVDDEYLGLRDVLEEV